MAGLTNKLSFSGINPALRNIAINYNARALATKTGKKKVIKEMKDAMNELVRKQDEKGLRNLMMMVQPSMHKESRELINELDKINTMLK